MTLRDLRDWAARCPGVMHDAMPYWHRVFLIYYGYRELPCGCRLVTGRFYR